MEEVLQKFLFDDIEPSAVKSDSYKVIQHFSRITNTVEKLNFALEIISDYYDSIVTRYTNDYKNNKQSSDLRIKGNELFLSKKYEEALEMYTYSIAHAEDKSENLGLAYANRSAVLFRLGFYGECEKDIEKAFENNYPDALKPKINERKEKALSLKAKQKNLQYYQPMPSIDVDDRNPLIECASNCVEIKNHSKLGRCIVAARDIKIGEVIAVESPTFSNLIDAKWCHCHHCFNLCYNLLPCISCTKALFCSSSCKNNSITYHKYECPILAIIENFHSNSLIPLHIAISMRDCYKTFEAEMKESDSVYKSGRYKEIHNLVTTEFKYSHKELFEMALRTAIYYKILRDRTYFFESCEDYKENFMKLIFKHLQNMNRHFHDIGELCQNSNGTYDDMKIGIGAYNFMSLFNHSSDPNVHRTYYGKSICMTAIKTIKKGKQLLDSFCHNYSRYPKSVRQSVLKNCHCLACENNWETCNEWKLTSDEFKIISPILNAAEAVGRGNLEIARKIRPHVIEVLKKNEKNPKEIAPHLLQYLRCLMIRCDIIFGNMRRSLA
ncbi:SET and MYND domain-containing protein 4-like isoform X3 [Harmonia axyridis]|uniref:SET and MYND domain-containing protein 4-like isoform X3 n=1 Tax=Harmonia axyridis TaxID=115357 RepID=UPI001E2762EF|nr:SET and MYND domain-containing protein 4-like isoform X3 [Harmonia axyridis]